MSKEFDLEAVRFLAEEVARLSIQRVHAGGNSSPEELERNMRLAAEVTFQHFMKRIPDDLDEARQLVQAVFDEAFAAEFARIRETG